MLPVVALFSTFDKPNGLCCLSDTQFEQFFGEVHAALPIIKGLLKMKAVFILCLSALKLKATATF